MSSVQPNNHKTYKETGRYGSFKGKNKPTETVPEKYLIEDKLDKDFKIIALKKRRELKEDVMKVKKMMCKQIENINKEKT